MGSIKQPVVLTDIQALGMDSMRELNEGVLNKLAHISF